MTPHVLVGQYDSPFVRRVAVALHHYGLLFERRVLSTFADFDAMLELGPLGKVPVFILPTGERLWDSRTILDFLHGQAPPELLLLPRDEPRRREVLRVEAAALGLAEKAYERIFEVARRAPGNQDAVVMARVERQIAAGLAWLESQRPRPLFHSHALSIADVTVAVAFSYIREKLPQFALHGMFPALETHQVTCEEIAPFKAAPYSSAEAARSGWRPEATSFEVSE